MGMNKKSWIQDAISKPGSFTSYCKKQGYKGVTKACIAKAKKSKNSKTRKRAVLASTLKSMKK